MAGLKVLTRQLDTEKLFALQRQQKYEIIPMTGVVPASTNSIVKVTVSNQGHFFCLFMVGSFTTLTAGPVDDAVNHLRGKLFSNNDPIFNAYTPFDLFLSPGKRTGTVTGTGAAVTPPFAPNSLFLQFPIEFLFPANTDIIMDTINDGTYANSFDIAFVGIRCSAYETVRGIKRPAQPAPAPSPRIAPPRRGFFRGE
jgi:hypothetical protein